MGSCRLNSWNNSRSRDSAFVYDDGLRNEPERHPRQSKKVTGDTEKKSYGDILKLIMLIVSPIILSAFIYNVNGYLNGVLYSEILGTQGADADKLSMMYAEYATYL